MSEQPIEGRPPTEAEKRLAALMQEMEKNQVDFLDAAGKRIVELTTTLLGVLFAVVALGKDFPPPYLKGNTAGQILALLTLFFYLAAMYLGMRTMQPRSYRLYRQNLSGMREELDIIIAYKSRSLKLGGVVFWLASLMLGLLIAVVILSG